MAEISGGNVNWVNGGGYLRVVGVLLFLGYLISHDGKFTVFDELFNVQILSHRSEIVVD